jgi:hypothetical protein
MLAEPETIRERMSRSHTCGVDTCGDGGIPRESELDNINFK